MIDVDNILPVAIFQANQKSRYHDNISQITTV